jgi:hypothetical protein
MAFDIENGFLLVFSGMIFFEGRLVYFEGPFCQLGL